jgi:hypothetical protein
MGKMKKRRCEKCGNRMDWDEEGWNRGEHVCASCLGTGGGRRKIIGYYNADGYRITDAKSGEDLYTGGNNPYESSSVVDRSVGLPLEEIKACCERTGKEMAEELGAEFLGAEEEDEES